MHCLVQEPKRESETLRLPTCALTPELQRAGSDITVVKCLFPGHNSALCQLWALKEQPYEYYSAL